MTDNVSVAVQLYCLVFDQIKKYENPRIFLVGKLKDFLLKNSLTDMERWDILYYVSKCGSGEDLYKYFKYLGCWGFLEALLPEVNQLSGCPQNKKNMKVDNALDHTLQVIRFACGLDELIVFLFHDVGKVYTMDKSRRYKNHEQYSAIHLYHRIKDMGLGDIEATKYYLIVKNHMLPHDYQRRIKNKWTDKQVLSFISKCGKLEYALATIDLAIADKRASHNVEKYIEPYVELIERCTEIMEKKDESEEVILCPICMSRGDKSVETIVEKVSVGYHCPVCSTFYRLVDDNLIVLNVTFVDMEVSGLKIREES